MRSRKSPAEADLSESDHARLFPSLGVYDARRDLWKLQIHGRVFREAKVPLSKRLLLRGLKKAMKASPEELASETFRQRIGGFLARPVRGKRIVLNIGGKDFRLRRRTRRNGSFVASIKVTGAWLNTVLGENPIADRSIPVRLIRSNAHSQDQGHCTSSIRPIEPIGISVVSDIDDTIKYTDSTCRQRMLTNTFLRPFEAVGGMAQLYQNWKKQGAEFHYVSSSPWELFEPLSELCQTGDFPAGSMHLRYFRIRDEMFKRWRPIRRKGKAGIIAGLMIQYPQRCFILVGDSGERDPEIYRILAKRFPKQVAGILIREIPDHTIEGKRRDKLQTLASGTFVRIFKTADELNGIDLSILARRT